MSEDFIDFEPEPVRWSVLKAKFPGRCMVCGDWIYPGEICEWAKECGIRHQERDGRCVCEMADGTWRYAV